MKKFPHQQFIENNGIALEQLPLMLQKRIKGFEELEDDLKHTTEHDQEQLVDKLELLSHEIEEDLEEQFEDQLENNDEREEEVVVETEGIKEIAEPSPVSIRAEALETIAENSKAVHEGKPLSGDEAILKKMYVSKQLTISPAHLIRNGFQTPLDNRIIRVGKYALHRGKYENSYLLLLVEK